MRKSWKRSWVTFLQTCLGRISRERTNRQFREVRLLVEALEDRTVPSVLTVSNTHDTDVAGDGSLRGEILAAQNGDMIQFSSTLKGKTITLTSNSDIIISKSITIQAMVANKIAVSGAGGTRGSRLFEIASGATVTIGGLTLENGHAAGSFTGGQPSAEGGAILDQGTLTLSDDVIKGNTATGSQGNMAGRWCFC